MDTSEHEGNAPETVELDDEVPSTEFEMLLPLHVTPPPNITSELINLDIVCEDGVIIEASTSKVVKDDALNQSVSASQILPLPEIKEKPNRCKSKSQKSEILSSTPFKDELEALAESRNAKEEKKKEKAKRKLVPKCKQSVTSRERKNKNKNDDEDVSCPGCGNLYSDSSEDWIMCSLCNTWWHESCTSYVMGEFICFNCEE